MKTTETFCLLSPHVLRRKYDHTLLHDLTARGIHIAQYEKKTMCITTLNAIDKSLYPEFGGPFECILLRLLTPGEDYTIWDPIKAVMLDRIRELDHGVHHHNDPLYVYISPRWNQVSLDCSLSFTPVLLKM